MSEMLSVAHAQQLEPSPWVRRFLPWIPNNLGAQVLDLAFGTGRHASYLVQAGYSVLAIDRDLAALAKVSGRNIETRQIDLEVDFSQLQWPCQANSLSGIVVTNYLHRPLLPLLANSLAPGGVLIYETFARGNAAFGKPSNPAFLLESGELFEFARHFQLHVLAFEDGKIMQPKEAMVQRICCIKLAECDGLLALRPLTDIE